jgi:hypothetical protein
MTLNNYTIFLLNLIDKNGKSQELFGATGTSSHRYQKGTPLFSG